MSAVPVDPKAVPLQWAAWVVVARLYHALRDHPVELVNLGRPGVKVSRICLGCMTYGSSKWRPWVLDEEASRPFFRRAWEAGINFFDTADMYSDGVSEEVLGPQPPRPGDPARAGRRRHQGLQPDGQANGQRAGPVAQAHPPRDRRQPAAAAARLRRPLPDPPLRPRPRRSRRRSKRSMPWSRPARRSYIGASSMFAWQMAKMLHTSDRLGLARFVTMQNHYNLVYREEEREMIPLCLDEGIGLIPWSPLARGFLAGNRRREDRRRDQPGQDRRLRPEHVLRRERLRGGRPGGRDRGEARASRTLRSRWPGCCTSRG